MKVDGACHCGQITFEAVIDARTVVICHCADCQSLSGAPYRAMVPVKAEMFHIRGTPKIYIKTAESGTKRAQGFCGNCGAAL